MVLGPSGWEVFIAIPSECWSSSRLHSWFCTSLLYINDLPDDVLCNNVNMLMIPLSTLNVIRHLICGNNYNWLLNLNLIYETLDWGNKWLVDFNAGKTFGFV